MKDKTKNTQASSGQVDRFVSEYLGIWEVTEEEKYLHSLAEEYHQSTEAYDRMVCTGPVKHGGIIPANNYEFVLINKNALAVRARLIKRAYDEYGISKENVTKAIQKFTR